MAVWLGNCKNRSNGNLKLEEKIEIGFLLRRKDGKKGVETDAPDSCI
jgi:hypothetical protein